MTAFAVESCRSLGMVPANLARRDPAGMRQNRTSALGQAVGRHYTDTCTPVAGVAAARPK
jgi:hypothetical protein